MIPADVMVFGLIIVVMMSLFVIGVYLAYVVEREPVIRFKRDPKPIPDCFENWEDYFS